MGIWVGCSHKNRTFPFTKLLKVPQARRVASTYVVCLDCGREMPYSWPEMKVMKERRNPQRKKAVAGAGLPAKVEA